MSRSTHRAGRRTIDLNLRVQPGARRSEAVGVYGAKIRLRIAAPPSDNRANEELIRFLAREFGVTRLEVELVSGHARRDKRVVIHDPRGEPRWCPPADAV
jgi:uncharacterized protein (TIGR00251 family)